MLVGVLLLGLGIFPEPLYRYMIINYLFIMNVSTLMIVNRFGDFTRTSL